MNETEIKERIIELVPQMLSLPDPSPEDGQFDWDVEHLEEDTYRVSGHRVGNGLEFRPFTVNLATGETSDLWFKEQ